MNLLNLLRGFANRIYSAGRYHSRSTKITARLCPGGHTCFQVQQIALGTRRRKEGGKEKLLEIVSTHPAVVWCGASKGCRRESELGRPLAHAESRRGGG